MLPSVAAAIVVLAIIGAIVVVVKQYGGYFTGHGPKRVANNASPTPTAAGIPTPIVPTPSPTVKRGPMVAIIIDDCGYSVPRDERFLKLPVPVTLSILPLTPHGKEVAAAALAAGKAVMLHIPMEPLSSSAHPGPGEISTEMTDDQIRAQLDADIASLPRLPGANNHMGSKASSDPRVMHDVLAILRGNGMFFIDSMTAPTSVGASTARDLGVPTAMRDVFLDDELTVPYIEGQIRELEADARRNGAAIAIGHPFPQTAQALEAMVPRMQTEGFVFVNAQSLVK